jgi:CyaY protein
MTTATDMPDEKLYRQRLDDTYARIDAAFEEVDPDLAEVSISQGTLVIVFHEKHKLMLTPQPSPRQLWAAFRDRAWHFDWNAASGRWLDDRGQGIELVALIEETTRDMTGIEIHVAR